MAETHTNHFSSVDPKEAEHFSKFSSTWWDEKGPYAILHRINPLRLTFTHSKIKQHLYEHLEAKNSQFPFQKLRLLDVGCGGGLFTEPMCRKGVQITGIDIVPENIAIAKQHAHEENLNIEYLCLPIEQLPTQTPQFDVVTAFEILEHVENSTAFLEQCKNVLRPGGLLILSTLNRTFLSYALGIIAAEKILKWVPEGTHQWDKFFTTHELTWCLEKMNFQHIAFQGISFRMLTQDWELSDDLNINYLACAVAA